MKISVRWLLDHLQGGPAWRDIDGKKLAELISKKIAEVESVEHVHFPKNCLPVRVVAVGQTSVTALVLEIDKIIELPLRTDALAGFIFFALQEKSGWRWAMAIDVGGGKSDLLPAISVHEDECKDGSWRLKVEEDDYLLTISNTSVTHRPDLWGHRGFARECALLWGAALRNQEQLLQANPIEVCSEQAAAEDFHPFSLRIADIKLCRRFASLYIPEITNKPSMLSRAVRLARVDSRPINALVDITNYVMFDWGHPLHAFDAQKIATELIVGLAQAGEKVAILDGTTKTLTTDMIVVRDAERVLSIAGVMGGKSSGVSLATKQLLLEAAWFLPSSIRKTSMTLGLRTEASARFEKELDLQGNLYALRRAAACIADDFGIETNNPIISLGVGVQQAAITVTHKRIEALLGVAIEQDFVLTALHALGFGVKEDQGLYHVVVPSFRSRDVTREQDIVEEVGRHFGLDNLPAQLPALQVSATLHTDKDLVMDLKKYCAFTLQAHEVSNYPVFEEQLFHNLGWHPAAAACVKIKNPVAQTASLLVNSLVPNLLGNILENQEQHESEYNFFEINSVWQRIQAGIEEHRSWALLFYKPKEVVDFYAKKELIDRLFCSIKKKVVWQKSEKELAQWFHPYKTAALLIDGNLVGHAGNIHPAFGEKCLSGDAFILEVNLDRFLQERVDRAIFKPLARYPDTWFDVSFVAQNYFAISQLEMVVKESDARIFRVHLRDLFSKEEWSDRRSVTLRIFARSQNETLSKDAIVELQQAVTRKLSQLGVEIR